MRAGRATEVCGAVEAVRWSRDAASKRSLSEVKLGCHRLVNEFGDEVDRGEGRGSLKTSAATIIYLIVSSECEKRAT